MLARNKPKLKEQTGTGEKPVKKAEANKTNWQLHNTASPSKWHSISFTQVAAFPQHSATFMPVSSMLLRSSRCVLGHFPWFFRLRGSQIPPCSTAGEATCPLEGSCRRAKEDYQHSDNVAQIHTAKWEGSFLSESRTHTQIFPTGGFHKKKKGRGQFTQWRLNWNNYKQCTNNLVTVFGDKFEFTNAWF